MAISNTVSSVSIRTKKEIASIGLGRNVDATIYWDAPVVTTVSNDTTGEVLSQSQESFVVQGTRMNTLFAGPRTFSTLNANLAYLLGLLEAEYTTLHP
jgi:hypothetical protein